jgi:hypothetical protein
MAWEKRGSRWFYYSVRRVDGKPTRRYLGRGPEAETTAAEVARRRQEQAALSQQLAADQARYNQAVTPLLDLHAWTDLLVTAHFLDLGFRKHGGEWRRTRHARGPASSTIGKALSREPTPDPGTRS